MRTSHGYTNALKVGSFDLEGWSRELHNHTVYKCRLDVGAAKPFLKEIYRTASWLEKSAIAFNYV
jgi:hypothetical protein